MAYTPGLMNADIDAISDASVVGKALVRASDTAAARTAIGAAAEGDEVTLVAGPNITIVESAGDVTISSLNGSPTYGIVPSISRFDVNGNTLATGTGNLRLSYFTAYRDGAFTKMRAWCGTTAAAATPTLVRFGVYWAAANENLTLVASTVNDTALFAAASTVYEKPLSVTVHLTAGQRYAYGFLIVTAAAAPTTHGMIFLTSTEAAVPPRLNGFVASQTDLPSTIAAGSVSASTTNMYMALVP